MEPKRYPVDFDQIQKGSVIAPETIEEWSGVSRDNRSYGLAILSFRDLLYEGLAERGKSGWVVVQQHSSLVVLKDAEASAYLERRVICGVQTVMRGHALLGSVDTSQLTDDQLAEHESRQMRASYWAAAIAGASKQIVNRSDQKQIP